MLPKNTTSTSTTSMLRPLPILSSTSSSSRSHASSTTGTSSTTTTTSTTTSKTKRHWVLGITGCFFVIAATVQLESFQGMLWRGKSGGAKTAERVDELRQQLLRKKMRQMSRTEFFDKYDYPPLNNNNNETDARTLSQVGQWLLEDDTTTEASNNESNSSSKTGRATKSLQNLQKLQRSSTTTTTSTTTRTTAAYLFDPTENDLLYNGTNPEVLEVRKWGCDRRQEAPLIFVHLGKCGGGSIRARLAASAVDYSREKWSNTRNDASYYYPMMEWKHIAAQVMTIKTFNTTTTATRRASQLEILHKGIFVNSGFHNFRPSYPATRPSDKKLNKADKVWKTYEKTLPCNATTPLGQAVACPLTRLGQQVIPSCNTERCNVVYAGHNLLGNELHWLPTPFLQQWWNSTTWARHSHTTDTAISNGKDLWGQRASRWNQPGSACHYEQKHPFHHYKEQYFDCVAPHEHVVDQTAHRVLSQKDSPTTSLIQDWSPVYASLPVLRITMMREPFSWLVSKYFWHDGKLRGADKKWVYLDTCDANNMTDFEHMAQWAAPAALKQINHLCGEECVVRQEAGLLTLDQIETQARHNLQHSFAVVGLLHETQSFYDMITARAAYMDTSLNPHVTGSKHSTAHQDEYERCRKIYQTPAFQRQFLAACPEFGALQRLYHVGAEVNRKQRHEMESCGLLPPKETTTAAASTSNDKRKATTTESS
ncbi:expressed unknown protein [Seminavis robusta]|uniref:Uncharacterized protein n=1 Tax=Seminavis robusta TaxID=568900 RepID=A0A9N8DJJ7_9STRA|nr:expressed unknown protein [Seminavis robusta]|eukprot:Sro193_g082570.1 n/a (709) ;mRNA; f:25121-27247